MSNNCFIPRFFLLVEASHTYLGVAKKLSPKLCPAHKIPPCKQYPRPSEFLFLNNFQNNIIVKGRINCDIHISRTVDHSGCASHGMPSPAGTLELWDRISLEAWMYVCVVYSRLATGLTPPVRSPTSCL
jgi:hypothetical protein